MKDLQFWNGPPGGGGVCGSLMSVHVWSTHWDMGRSDVWLACLVYDLMDGNMILRQVYCVRVPNATLLINGEEPDAKSLSLSRYQKGQDGRTLLAPVHTPYAIQIIITRCQADFDAVDAGSKMGEMLELVSMLVMSLCL